jgi:hypothetical protein
MITLSLKKRIIKMPSFEKLIDALKDRSMPVRIQLQLSPENDGQFLKVLWSGEAGILLQNESTKEFIAIEDVRLIYSFELNDALLSFKPFKKYYLK